MDTTPIYERSFGLAQSIEGMMSPFSMQVMDSLLEMQEQAGAGGHLVEFGVYKGKSAAILAHRRKANERLILVDIEKYVTDQTLAAFPGPSEFFQCSSEDFERKFQGAGGLAGLVRFLHVDSSHAYRTTFAEMGLANRLLAPHGVVCLDDFANLNYSQILPAVYKYLFTQRTDLTVFLVTNEKCYLCRRPYFAHYAQFVLDRLIDEVNKRGSGPITLARTDVDEEYSAFYLRESLTPDEGRFYGDQIYGHLYAKADPVKMHGLSINRAKLSRIKRLIPGFRS